MHGGSKMFADAKALLKEKEVLLSAECSSTAEYSWQVLQIKQPNMSLAYALKDNTWKHFHPAGSGTT